MNSEAWDQRDEKQYFWHDLQWQVLQLVVRFRASIIQETDMTWREVWVSEGLSTKTHAETTTTCYLEYHSEDGFAVIFFGNSAIKSTGAANTSNGNDPTSHVHIGLSGKESGSVSAECGCPES